LKKQKVIVSACLLGEYCRYDGQTKKDEDLIAWLEDKNVIPFCPEAPVMGTPRARINVVRQAHHFTLVREDNGQDMTHEIINETQKMIESDPDTDLLILKSKSPSCGCGTTPIFDEDGKEILKGDGIATMTFKKVFRNIYDEINYKEYTC